MTNPNHEPLYLGFDLSTQQLKALLLTSSLKIIHSARVTFSVDLPQYNTVNGVLTSSSQNVVHEDASVADDKDSCTSYSSSDGEVFAPVAMWLEALDLVLQRMRDEGVELERVRGICGSGQQHGSVYWNAEAETRLSSLRAGVDYEGKGGDNLVGRLCGDGKRRVGSTADGRTAFSSPWSPNWQDSSTQLECDAFEQACAGPEGLCSITGSRAHHRFTGPQIMKLRKRQPEVYAATSRISLVSSFLASVLIGKFAPIDISDVCGMDLWDIKEGKFDNELLELTAGPGQGKELRRKLGDIYEDGGKGLGPIAAYFVEKYGFSETCTVSCFTGDNPATILALPLRPLDAIISLGTSTTFLMATTEYVPDPEYHLFNSPTTPGVYMFMLCYKNGGLAREIVRDGCGKMSGNDGHASWEGFNRAVLDTAPLCQKTNGDEAKLGLYYPRPEIVPNVRAGTWKYSMGDGDLKEVTQEDFSQEDARMIIESQMLSIRLRSQKVITKDVSCANNNNLPPQPRRIYCVGGGSVNEAIIRVIGDVLGATEGIWRLDVSDACALGGAYKAVWAYERRQGERFEDFIGARWTESEAVRKVGEGYDEGLWKVYGDALSDFEKMERLVVTGTSS